MNKAKIVEKRNGYAAAGIQPMMEIFNRAALNTFPGCVVEHFIFGETASVTTVKLQNGGIGHFNITKNRVSLSSQTCYTAEDFKGFQDMTYNDELFRGRLFEIAE